MSTGNTSVTRWKRTRFLERGEGKHPVGRANVTKTEDPRRIRGAKAKGRKKRNERSRWQTGYRIASFLHNLARQPREKLVLPRARATEVQRDSRERDGPGRAGEGPEHSLISYDLVLDATTQLKHRPGGIRHCRPILPRN